MFMVKNPLQSLPSRHNQSNVLSVSVTTSRPSYSYYSDRALGDRFKSWISMTGVDGGGVVCGRLLGKVGRQPVNSSQWFVDNRGGYVLMLLLILL